jgi:sugar porter (SP) family MFS transporter
MVKITCIAALAGLLFGFDTGIISGAIFFIKDAFELDIFMTQVVVSIVLFGAFMGSICSAKLTNNCSRRFVIKIDSVLFIISTLCSSLAPSIFYLLIGRFGVGFAIGIASYIIPLYISELSPARFRGRLVALNTIAVTGGILISYVTCSLLSPLETWRWMFGIGIFPAVALWIGVQYLPESPRWLIKQGNLSAAKQWLYQFRASPHEADEEFKGIIKSLNETRPSLRELFQPKIRKLILIGSALAIIQQITGINTILYYAPILFQSFGFHSTSTIMLLTISIGLINFLMTILVMLKVDKIGRKTILLFGLSAMSISLITLGILLKFDLHNIFVKLTTILSLFSFVAFYASSIGCIFWIVIAEIYPLHIRGFAMGLVSSVNWASNLLVSLTFLGLLNAIGASSTFFCYSIASLCSLLFCSRFLSETAQCSLEELESSDSHSYR